MKPTNPVYTGLPTTIFEVMSRLAIEHGAINLGQGFPDVDGPEDIRRFAADALVEGSNQYPPMMGVPELRQAVAKANRRFYDLDIDWTSEVVVTSGATEALSDCMAALIEPGDEVILFEPLYDCYLPLVRRRHPSAGPPDAARMESRPARTGGGFRSQDQGHPDQRSDEPGGQGLHRQRTRHDRRPMRRA